MGGCGASTIRYRGVKAPRGERRSNSGQPVANYRWVSTAVAASRRFEIARGVKGQWSPRLTVAGGCRPLKADKKRRKGDSLSSPYGSACGD